MGNHFLKGIWGYGQQVNKEALEASSLGRSKSSERSVPGNGRLGYLSQFTTFLFLVVYAKLYVKICDFNIKMKKLASFYSCTV